MGAGIKYQVLYNETLDQYWVVKPDGSTTFTPTKADATKYESYNVQKSHEWPIDNAWDFIDA